MILSRIKPAHKDTVVAFGNNGKPLGYRDDIDDLAILALETQDKRLLSYFEYLPTLAQLKKKDEVKVGNQQNVVDNNTLKDGKNTAKDNRKSYQKARI